MNKYEHFESDKYRFDFSPKLNTDAITYIEYENNNRKNEFSSHFRNVYYYISRDTVNLSLHATICTGLFEDDINIPVLRLILDQLEKNKKRRYDILSAGEIYVIVKYREISAERLPLHERYREANKLFSTTKYETLSQLNSDIIDTINTIEDYIELSKLGGM